MKVVRSLWDTGASVSLISARVAKVLGLFDSDEYDVVIGMDVIGKGDLAVTNLNDRTTFTFRIPSEEVIDFSKE